MQLAVVSQWSACPESLKTWLPFWSVYEITLVMLRHASAERVMRSELLIAPIASETCTEDAPRAPGALALVPLGCGLVSRGTFCPDRTTNARGEVHTTNVATGVRCRCLRRQILGSRSLARSIGALARCNEHDFLGFLHVGAPTPATGKVELLSPEHGAPARAR